MLERIAGIPAAADQMRRVIHALLPRYVAPTNATQWTRRVPDLRRETVEKVYLKGWPRKIARATPRVVWTGTLRPDPSYVIRKLRYEIYPDYWIPALLYEPTRLRKPAPVVINCHGHYIGGNPIMLKQARCINLARRGMIAMSVEFIGTGQLNGEFPHQHFAYLDWVGLRGQGFFFQAVSKALDVALSRPHVDRKRVCVTGLSGGGTQTSVLASLDPRITACVPVAGYTSIRVRATGVGMGDYEQLPADMAVVLPGDYQAMTAMLAPRPTLQILNERDSCFPPGPCKSSVFDELKPTWKAYGASENFEYYCNRVPGTHNYGPDNRSQLYRFLGKHFGTDGQPGDLHRPCEILSEPELMVTMPAYRTSWRVIGRAMAQKYAAAMKTPRTAAQKRSLRKKLAGVIRMPKYALRASREGGSGRAKRYRLKVGPWTLPAAVIDRGRDANVELVLADTPAGGEARAKQLRKNTVVLADILFAGRLDCSPAYGLQLAAAGQRALGIQVAQIVAIARFAARQGPAKKRIRLSANGNRTSFAATVAAALYPELFESLTCFSMHACFSTLCNLFDQEADYNDIHTMLCPDLLTVIDMPQLIALADPVVITHTSRRTRPIRLAEDVVVAGPDGPI